MKILVLADAPLVAPRGISHATVQLVESLAHMGHQVDVLSWNHTPASFHSRDLRRLLPPFLAPPQRLLSLGALTWAFLRYPARSQVDVIHSIDATLSLAAFCRQFYGTPFIHAMFSSVSDPANAPCARVGAMAARWEVWGIRQSSGVVVASRALEELVTNYTLNVPVMRVDDTLTNTSCLGLAGSFPRPSWQSPQHATIMYVGDLARDQQILLDAFAYFSYRQSQGQLVAIGGSLRDIRHAQARAKTLRISERTHFLGSVPPAQLPQLLKCADILVAPSHQGHFPSLKLYTYQAAQRPILATRIPAHLHVFDNMTAYFVDPTALDLASGMQHVLKRQPKYRSHVYDTQVHMPENSPNRDITIAKLCDFYADIEDRLSRGIQRTT